MSSSNGLLIVCPLVLNGTMDVDNSLIFLFSNDLVELNLAIVRMASPLMDFGLLSIQICMVWLGFASGSFNWARTKLPINFG